MKRIAIHLVLGAAALLPLQALAQGTIVYVNPPDFLIQQDDTLHSFDLNGDGTFDIGFRNVSDELDAVPTGNNQVSATAKPPPEVGGPAVPIPFGAQVNSSTPWQGRYSAPFVSDSGPLLASNRGSLVAYGPFAGLDGYLGIRFYIGANLHYGWIRLNLNNGYPAQAIGFITEWAYNSVPGQSIAAGAVPEPSTWALLIAGGVLVCLRKWK